METEVNERRVLFYIKKHGITPLSVISADLDLGWNEIKIAIENLLEKKLIEEKKEKSNQGEL